MQKLLQRWRVFVVIVLLLAGALAIPLFRWQGFSSLEKALLLRRYQQIEVGMTEAQVVKMLGRQPDLRMGGLTEALDWYEPDLCIRVTTDLRGTVVGKEIDACDFERLLEKPDFAQRLKRFLKELVQ
jgi:hypothetical protein